MPLEAAVRSGMNETSTMQPPATSAPICLVFITHLSFLESPPLQLAPYRFDLLKYLLVGQQPLSHQYSPCSLCLEHHGPEQFLERDGLAWIGDLVSEWPRLEST